MVDIAVSYGGHDLERGGLHFLSTVKDLVLDGLSPEDCFWSSYISLDQYQLGPFLSIWRTYISPGCSPVGTNVR